MRPCCNYSTVQYLNPDGSIDFKALNEAIKEVHGEAAIPVKEGDFGINCRCLCHTKGAKCRH